MGVKTEKEKIIEVFRKENVYLREGNWKRAYQCFSPSFRKTCPYQHFEKVVGGLTAFGQRAFGRVKFKFADVKVKIKGNTALISYEIKVNKKIIYSTPPGFEDIYVKEKGRWYDSGNWISPYVKGETDYFKRTRLI